MTAAIKNMKPYKTDILCMPWYWGGQDEKEHNANRATCTVTIHDFKWKSAEEAIRRLEETLKWRREYGLYDLITAEHVEPEVRIRLYHYQSRLVFTILLRPSQGNRFCLATIHHAARVII